MPDWSEGSLFVLLGIQSQNKELMLKGFKLIHEDRHKLAPTLMSILHERLKEANLVGPHEIESEEQVLGWMVSYINGIERCIEDSEIVEAFLADISKDHH